MGHQIEANAETGAGLIRLTTSDSLLQAAMPVIRDFQIQHPGVQIEVTAGNGALNLARGECDVALRATCNPPENLVGRKIAIIEWAPFACTGIDLTGTIYDREWVSYAGSLTNLKAALFLAQRVALQRIIYKSDTVLGVASAVREGIGIGYLPCRGDYTKVTYLHAKGEQIRYDASRCYSQAFLPLLCGAALRAPIWEGGNPIDQRSR